MDDVFSDLLGVLEDKSNKERATTMTKQKEWAPDWLACRLPPAWRDLVDQSGSLWSLKYMRFLQAEIAKEYQSHVCFPPEDQILSAFEHCADPSQVRVVIVGQDPYYNRGLANGMAFSVAPGVSLPPSLQNILREVGPDVLQHRLEAKNGDLTCWARQGVLLLNSCLTVRSGQPNSHAVKYPWSRFTSTVIQKLTKAHTGLVFMLWGRNAQAAEKFIENREQHMILKTSHPSPKSVDLGFAGCGHFQICNAFLTSHHKKPIDWH